MLSLLPELPKHIREQSVLLVDDSLFQRELISALLQAIGIHDIWHAQDGREALTRLQQHQGPLPLLVVDLEMPGMDGIELLQCLAEEKIHPNVIIASGREQALISTVEGMLQALGLPLLGSLAKPVSAQQLHALLAFQHPPKRPASWLANTSYTPTVEALALAIRDRRIVPYYQPKVALKSGRLIGYEVLARWQHEDNRLISPADFIPLASSNGLLRELTFSLLELALRDTGELTRAEPPLHMALNLDISLLADRSFAELLIQCVQRAGGRPEQWILEVTESSLMHDPGVTLGSVGRLRLAGFGLSIDDYGTGFSTLQQLTRLPFTELKIDRTFVTEAQHNLRAEGVLRAAIETGRTLNLPCIAEGIESQAEAQLLERLGCFAGQGYLFARPMAADCLPDWHRTYSTYSSLAQWFGA